MRGQSLASRFSPAPPPTKTNTFGWFTSVSHLSTKCSPPLAVGTDLYLLPLPLDSSGHVYQSTIALQNAGGDSSAAALPLPHSLLLRLPVGEGRLEAAAAQVLDESHLAVVGVPHPSAGAGKGEHHLEASSGCL